LYYVMATTDRPGPLMRQRLAGGELAKVADDVVAFDVVAEGIYYIERRVDVSRLRYLDLATGKFTLILDNLGPLWFGLSASADGRQILYSRVDSSVDDLMLVENFR
jgi:hypothetical protein